MQTVVIVDDNLDILFTSSVMFKTLGYQCLVYHSGTRFLEHLPEFDFLLLNYHIEQDTVTGKDVLIKVKECRPDAKVWIISGFADLENDFLGLVQGVITKPFVIKEIVRLFERTQA